MLPVEPTGTLPRSVATYLGAHRSTIASVQVFGGSRAVGTAVAGEAAQAG
ncbi:MAG: hypothetical protein ACRD0J_16840 [Acidimicrobiales bacterium]